MGEGGTTDAVEGVGVAPLTALPPAIAPAPAPADWVDMATPATGVSVAAAAAEEGLARVFMPFAFALVFSALAAAAAAAAAARPFSAALTASLAEAGLPEVDSAASAPPPPPRAWMVSWSDRFSVCTRLEGRSVQGEMGEQEA